METRKNKIKNTLLNALELILVIGIAVTLYSSIYYNEKLEYEIQKRDIRIENLLKNDSLLHKVLDFRTDTIKNTEYYILRKEDGQTLSYDDLATKLDSSRNRYIEDVNKLNHENYELSVQNSIYETALSLIKRHYGIEYKYQTTKDKHIIELITPNKVDSALILFPYFKHRLKSLKRLKDGSIEYSIEH